MWFKVDDSFYDHPKVSRLTDAQVALWLRSGCWSVHHLTDGRVPLQTVRRLGTKASAQALVKVGLWEELADGYRFHDWELYQPDAEEHRARREHIARVRSEAGRKGAAARWHPDGKTDGKSHDKAMAAHKQTDGPEPEPEPEDPSNKLDGSPRRGKKLPSGWAPDDVLRQWTSREAPSLDIDAEVEKFRDYWTGNGKPMKDWPATWRNWARKAHGWNVERGWRPRLDDGDEWSFR